MDFTVPYFVLIFKNDLRFVYGTCENNEFNSSLGSIN